MSTGSRSGQRVSQQYDEYEWEELEGDPAWDETQWNETQWRRDRPSDDQYVTQEEWYRTETTVRREDPSRADEQWGARRREEGSGSPEEAAVWRDDAAQQAADDEIELSESSPRTQAPVPKRKEPINSPLAGIIRRGSIGGTGERGANYSMVPPTIDEDAPFVGRVGGGGKLPVVQLIRRGSISGIGERGYAPSYIGSDEPKAEAGKEHMGMHDPRLREKARKMQPHMKRKEPPSYSGSKYAKEKSAYYMSKFGKKNVPGSEAMGVGKGPSTVGCLVGSNVTDTQSGVGHVGGGGGGGGGGWGGGTSTTTRRRSSGSGTRRKSNGRREDAKRTLRPR